MQTITFLEPLPANYRPTPMEDYAPCNHILMEQVVAMGDIIVMKCSKCRHMLRFEPETIPAKWPRKYSTLES